MVFTLPTGITHGSKSRISDPQFHPRVDEQYNNNDPRNCGGSNYNHLWVCIKQMVWRKYNTYFSNIWRNSGFRFSIYPTYSWRSLYSRSNNKGSKSSVIRNRNRKRNRHYFYYGLLISLLSIAPVRAEEGETNNTSNPVAAATGNVTNQAVQFQNNGAPSRQHYGPNISCNGSTMTFSPFYMGNHTKPFDIDDDGMRPSSYTMAENWGFQVNFMVPLDKRGLERCRSMAARQEEKMRLDYELVRALKCAELQTKGFMIHPKSELYPLCADIVPIASYLKSTQPPIPKEKPWYNPF
ncbi:gp165 [Cyanophage NATL1A-7]|uniref:Gp165 n=1 Tax=Cyanophage NATL1A-7 TaxID=445693 RepID=E3SNC8_9CAUD|nr:gp165 [Cyanophage NATL1A-7]ADP00132.1 gp165 [Cyanophage NATL1A-7]